MKIISGILAGMTFAVLSLIMDVFLHQQQWQPAAIEAAISGVLFAFLFILFDYVGDRIRKKKAK